MTPYFRASSLFLLGPIWVGRPVPVLVLGFEGFLLLAESLLAFGVREGQVVALPYFVHVYLGQRYAALYTGHGGNEAGGFVQLHEHLVSAGRVELRREDECVESRFVDDDNLSVLTCHNDS